MIIIIGGAYQGKLAYVKEHYRVVDADIWSIESEEHLFNTNKKVIYGLDKWILEEVKKGNTTVNQQIKENIDKLKDKIIVCEEISCGVVPIDQVTRLWREEVGRSMTVLGKHCEEMIRIFCGIGTRLK